MNPSKIYPSYHYGLAILKDAMKCKYYTSFTPLAYLLFCASMLS